MLDELAAISSARKILEKYSGAEVRSDVSEEPGPDAILTVREQRFLVEVKSSSRSGSVAGAIAHLVQFRSTHPGMSLLLVVPIMGEVGSQICEHAGVNWLDLAGNCYVHTSSLHIFVRGQRRDSTHGQIQVEPGASINPFGRKASRISHALLSDPRREWTRADLEATTDLDKGYVSKIITSLKQRGLVRTVETSRAATIQVVSPLVFVESWREFYKAEEPFAWGLIPSLSGTETAHSVSRLFSDHNIEYAITGLGAAACYTNFGTYRRVDAYVSKTPPEDVLDHLHTSDDDTRGRNVVLIKSRTGVSIGTTIIDGMRIASPVLTYLDLRQLPERSSEASDEMRRYLELKWK